MRPGLDGGHVIARVLKHYGVSGTLIPAVTSIGAGASDTALGLATGGTR